MEYNLSSFLFSDNFTSLLTNKFIKLSKIQFKVPYIFIFQPDFLIYLA